MSYSGSRSVRLACSFLIVCSTLVCAQNGPPAHPPKPRVIGPAKWNPVPQEISAAYWTLEPGWNTTLEMRNNLHSRELTVTPVLRTAATRRVTGFTEPCPVRSENSQLQRTLRFGCISFQGT